MKENVGKTDQVMRSVLGPMLIAAGYSRLARGGSTFLGSLGIMAGTALLESAITRVCPLNELMGVDTRDPLSAAQDRAATLEESRLPVEREASVGMLPS